MPSMNIIINVDDLGLHPAVGRAVVRLGDAGTVTSTTAMANGPHTGEAVAAVREACGGRVGIGVHLNILRGRPISPPEQIPTLTDPETGLFLGSWSTLFLKYLAGRIDPADVAREWDAQITAIENMGVAPTHLDGEKHTHAFPTWFNIACNLAKKHSIRWVRRPVERGSLFDFSIPGLRTKILNGFSIFHSIEADIGVPDLVWGIADQGKRLTPGGLGRYLKENSAARVVEVVCHPGLAEPGDPELPEEFGTLRVDRQWSAEFNALLSDQWHAVVHSLGGKLVHYGLISPK